MLSSSRVRAPLVLAKLIPIPRAAQLVVIVADCTRDGDFVVE
jgi:hypothetical protein